MDYEYLINNLKLHGFIPHLLDNSKQFIELMDTLILPNSSVGFGGSETIRTLGVKEHLASRNVQLCTDHATAHVADWYMSSTNAISMTGELVYIDGFSNRIAGIVNGPLNLLIVLGHNKITSDVAAAIERTRNVAAPPNCVRLDRNTPCKTSGKCSYCNDPDCICNNTLIQHHPSRGRAVHIAIIKEDLGY